MSCARRTQSRATFLRSLLQQPPTGDEVATRTEALGILTRLARDGRATAAIALARELRDEQIEPEPRTSWRGSYAMSEFCEHGYRKTAKHTRCPECRPRMRDRVSGGSVATAGLGVGSTPAPSTPAWIGRDQVVGHRESVDGRMDTAAGHAIARRGLRGAAREVRVLMRFLSALLRQPGGFEGLGASLDRCRI